MDWGDSSNVITAAMAVAAVIISLVALRHSKRALAIEERRERKEMDREAAERKQALKADLRARIGRFQSENYDTLEVHNQGSAWAEEVEVLLDGIPLMRHELFAAQRPVQEKVRSIGPDRRAQYHFIADGQTPPLLVSVTWSDDSGEPGRYSEKVAV